MAHVLNVCHHCPDVFLVVVLDEVVIRQAVQQLIQLLAVLQAVIAVRTIDVIADASGKARLHGIELRIGNLTFQGGLEGNVRG
jgi:hypothetical protein